jgi:hypothetical protein
MARTNATNFAGALQFPYATAATDLFKKEDIQTLAQAVDQHDHSTGKGLALQQLPTVPLVGNLLTNGGFEIWQRGNGPFGNNVPSADRWTTQAAGTDTISVSRDTTNKDVGSTACMAVTFTLGTGAGASGVYQAISLTDNPSLPGRVVAVSMRVRCSTANAVRLGLNTGSGSVFSTFHTGGGAYETLTVSGTIAASGTAYVNPVFAASCTAYLDNACLVVGSTPATYEPLHPADDLLRCLRYYQRWGIGTSGAILAAGQAYAGTNAIVPLPIAVQQPVVPTLTVSAAGDFTLTAANAATQAVTGLTYGGGTKQAAYLSCTVASGLVAGNATVLQAGNTSGWLALEANP